MLKTKFYIIFLVLILFSCSKPLVSNDFSEKEAWKYFKEIALNSEYKSKSSHRIKKWASPIFYILKGDVSKTNREEFSKIVLELRKLSNIQIKEVKNIKNANVIIFFGLGEDYVSFYEPQAKNMIKNNDGVFWIYWNRKKEIYKASIYINTKVKSVAQKHLLREEFTQILGLINDSYKYTNSIFQQDWTYTLKYAKIDKFLIQVLYDDAIKPNMTNKEVKRNFPKLYEKYYSK